MKIMLMAASVAALAFASADVALAQGNGKGNGGGKDKGGAEQSHGKGGGGDHGHDKGGGPGNGNGGGKAEAKAEAKAERAEAKAERKDPRPERNVVIVDRRDERRADDRRDDRRFDDRRGDNRGPDVRRADPRRVDDDRADRIFFRVRDRGPIAGCPPGLAKKNNGCLPPGQAKKLNGPQPRYEGGYDTRYDGGYDPRYASVWDRWDDNYDYRYDNGYLYRTSPQGGVLGYLPVLGGALGLGQLWPAQYSYDPVPNYYSSYYDLPDRYQYRYADGALYGLDPQTQTISQVAALLTGQDWTVGQQMPPGYDVYNLPYDYRARYPDSAQDMYRYSDGYVYQVDPKTRLVQAVIQLLT